MVIQGIGINEVVDTDVRIKKYQSWRMGDPEIVWFFLEALAMMSRLPTSDKCFTQRYKCLPSTGL